MDVNKRKKKWKLSAQNSKKHTFAILLFLIYFVVLFYFLFFSEKLGRTFSERSYHYNLIPFLEIRRFIQYCEILGFEAVLLNIVGNIAAFSPFGFFLPIFSRRCRYFWNTVFYSFELSLLVELIQLVTKVGSFDVDDLLLNTIGGACGFFSYKIFMWLIRKIEKGNITK